MRQICPRIAKDLRAIVPSRSNLNWIFQNRVAQFLLALLPPVVVVGYGHLQGIDPFLLYASQGWLFLLVLLAFTLGAILGYLGLLACELNLLSL